MTQILERYNGLSRALHWLSALIITALIVVGLYMTGLAKDDPSRRTIFAMHISMGIVTLFLVIARIVWLRISPAPALPAVFNEKEKRVTKGVQALLYVLMILVPVSGYFMVVTKGFPVSFFGLFNMPSLMGKDDGIHELAEQLHALFAYGIIALVALHVAGAVKHRLANKGGPADVLARML